MIFPYRVSVIVPVYNVAQYLAQCLDSLVTQTISAEEVEIIVVNDGSPDGSGAIARAYADAFESIRYYEKENGGLSSARNFGIDHARGKYLMFLDSDDMFSPTVVASCADFFDGHYDDIDLVTYKDQPVRFGDKLRVHQRYQYLKKSGIYDLREYPFITQTRINVCVKNLGADNFRFDETPHFRQEDQDYCSRVLRARQRIGFVAGCEYLYNKGNDDSIVSSLFSPIELFETSTHWFEQMFGSFSDVVPTYYQGLLINDLAWKLVSNVLWPYHYGPEALLKAQQRIQALLARVDESTILDYPEVDTFHRHYLLSLRPRSNVALVLRRDRNEILVCGRTAYERRNFEIILTRCSIQSGCIDIVGYVKSPIFNYTGEEEIPTVVVLNEDLLRSDSEPDVLARLTVFSAAESSYHCRTRTNRFWAFRFRRSVDWLNRFSFAVEVDGVRSGVTYWCAPSSPFPRQARGGIARFREADVCLDKGVFRVVRDCDRDKSYADLLLSSGCPAPLPKRLFSAILSLKTTRRVWLYVDPPHDARGNGYVQFLHDSLMEDGVDRYYATSELDGLGNLERDETRIIPWGGSLHRVYCLAAEKILTSAIGPGTFAPFSESERESVKSLLTGEVVYLQHGVLHASLPSNYSIDWNPFDRVVVSTKFEIENFQKRYHFSPEDLIPCGMARLDNIDLDAVPMRRILFAPSWRSYFATRGAGGSWQVSASRLFGSSYFRNLRDFLMSPDLAGVLARHRYTLDFKPHPILGDALGKLEMELPNCVSIVDTARPEDYAVFLTDFSSFVFDFVYLKRPIIYFVPDWDEFRSGMNAYRDLDLPFEDAFGPLVVRPGDAVTSLEEILANRHDEGQRFRQRMAEFFLPGDGHARRLYEVLMGIAAVNRAA